MNTDISHVCIHKKIYIFLCTLLSMYHEKRPVKANFRKNSILTLHLSDTRFQANPIKSVIDVDVDMYIFADFLYL